jgi:hypothetical protein
MASRPRVTVRTMGLLVAASALGFWLFAWLARTPNSPGGSAMSPPGAAVIVGLVGLGGAIVGLACRRGIDRTLAHTGLAAVLMLGLTRLAAATDLVGIVVALGAVIVLAALLTAALLAPEAREHRSAWWWEAGATIAAGIASVGLVVVVLVVLFIIFMMTTTLD